MTNDTPNGNDRLDRIERILESVAERQDALTRQHEAEHEMVMAEIKALLKWQVVMQSQLDEVLGERRKDREASRLRDERVDKLVSAIGQFVSAIPRARQ